MCLLGGVKMRIAATLALMILLGAPPMATGQDAQPGLPPAGADMQQFESKTPRFDHVFSHHKVDANGVRLHYVIGGKGEPVVLLHGWAETWFTWRRIMPELSRHYTVIAPDLRGIGDSGRPTWGYDDNTLAEDVRQLLLKLGYKHALVVGHDLGTQVAYALAARHPETVGKLVLLDAPVPGIPPWDDLLHDPRLWHWTFYNVPDLPEALITGREALYFSWFYRQIAVNIGAVEEDLAEVVRAYSQPGALRAGLAYFRNFAEDARQNAGYAEHKLDMPVLALGGASGNGTVPLEQMRLAATDVQGGIIEDCGHWIPTEQPEELTRRLLAFFGTALRAK
jgi:pimeloyl-ACP methyl ester carboxylesterase